MKPELITALQQELKGRDWLRGSLAAACEEAELMLAAGHSVSDAAYSGLQAAKRHERNAPITELVAHEVERRIAA